MLPALLAWQRAGYPVARLEVVVLDLKYDWVRLSSCHGVHALRVAVHANVDVGRAVQKKDVLQEVFNRAGHLRYFCNLFNHKK